MLLINGDIRTMDKNNPRAEAVAIKNGKILKIGSNSEILSFKKDKMEVIDLEGKLLLPGFNDSHIHLVGYSLFLELVDLHGVDSIEGIIEKCRQEIKQKNLEKGKWLRGRGWNQDYFQGERRFPNRYDLDKISTEHPIILSRTCGHIIVVNSKALEIAGVTKDTKQVDNGHFDVDENGEPLGIFRGKASELINRFVPSPTKEDIKRQIVKGMEEANKHGITSVHSDDFGILGYKNFQTTIEIYKELKEEGKMTLRVYKQCQLPSLKLLQDFLDKGYGLGYGDEFFKIGSLKLLADGSLGARTAALTIPYKDNEETKGIALFSQEELDELVNLAHENHMPVAIHSIGNRAMHMVFEAIGKALSKNPRKDHRHGIIHCQITDENLLNKFKELDVLAYIQPIFLDYDWRIVESRVGKELARTSYNWRSLVDRGVHIACGSDCPVESFNVLHGIYEAVTRKDLEGNPKEGWLKDQKLSVEEAIYGFTMGGAYASFEEDIKGSIEEGKLADMVVLSRNIFQIPEDEIKDVEVEMTIFNGEIL